jgi:hypothetical protein
LNESGWSYQSIRLFFDSLIQDKTMEQLSAAHQLLRATAAAISWDSDHANLAPPVDTDIALLGSRGLRGLYFMHQQEVPSAIARDRAIWAHQRTALLQLLDAADRRGIPMHVFKGAQICEKYFGSIPLGTKGDVDIIVPPDAEKATRTLLGDLGYIQADFDTNTLQLVPCGRETLDKHEKNNYTLKSFVRLEKIEWAGRGDGPYGFSSPTMNSKEFGQLLMNVDVAIGLDSSIDCTQLFARATPSAFGIGKALSVEDHYWYLCSVFYLKMFMFKSKVQLGQLCEIGILLAREHKAMDWDYLLHRANLHDLFSPLFYLTSFLDELTNLNLPQQILTQFDPRRGTRNRDFGWQFPKIFGLLDAFPSELLPECAEAKNAD